MPKTKRDSFSDRLVKIRKAKGLSQYDLADMTGISHRMIVHYEKWIKKLSPETLMRLARALNVTIDELVGYKAVQEKQILSRNVLHNAKLLDSLPLDDRKTVLKMIATLNNQKKRK